MSNFSIDNMCKAAKESLAQFIDLTVAKNLAQMICEAEPNDAKFKYQARLMWWTYCDDTQSAVTFRDFWDNEVSYPRTIK